MGIFNQDELTLPKPNYEYITTKNRALEVLKEIDSYDIIEVDTETTGLDPFTSKIVLLQLGVDNRAYVFDVRHDTKHSDISIDTFKDLLTDRSKLKLLQNAAYDMKMIKVSGDYYIENIYDTMLVEQLFNLGIKMRGFSLGEIVFKYTGLRMNKETATTFQDYNQVYKPYQLEYAASDVVVLGLIREMQLPMIEHHGFEDVCRLEFDFVKSLCEMELNGISMDVDKWRIMIKEMEVDKEEQLKVINAKFIKQSNQSTLFGVSMVNIDSPSQLKKALKDFGLELDSTSVETLNKYAGLDIIDSILKYRKTNKFISTYGENLIDRINPVTGKLHTSFRQLVSTGRMSSSRPNMQNIPAKQKFRSCFVAEKGKALVTADMSGAELRILGNLSNDPIFIHCYSHGIDIHTKTASEIYKVTMEEAAKSVYRKPAKAVGFGICYGMSKYGLSNRLSINEREADEIIKGYLNTYSYVSKFLTKSGKDAVRVGYSRSISNRKRFYNLPPTYDPERKNAERSVERQAKNAPIQGCVAFDSQIRGVGAIGKCVGQEVLLETGFGKDTATGVYSGKKEVYNLRTSNGINLGITLEHKIPVCTGFDLIDKHVENIDLNKDMLMLPLDVVGGKETDLSGYKYEKGHWRETYVEQHTPTTMTSDLAFIIGSLIGDGCYTTHNNFRFVCPEYQIELLDKFNRSVSDTFGCRVVVREVIKGRYTKLYTSQVSSVVIRGFLKHIGLDYVTAKDKSVPEYFHTETVENKGALLNGLFSTDGGMTEESGPNYTTVSKQLAEDIHNLLFSLGINSNLKVYNEKKSLVYRIQIPKRFNNKFKDLIGFSVSDKNNKLKAEGSVPKFGDDSVVPEFIPKLIEGTLRKSATYFEDFTTNEKAHLRRFKHGECSFTSWRKFYHRLPECSEKKYLSKFLNFDFCKAVSLEYRGKEDTYDLMCDKIHYFTANGVVVHNSNADTIKQSMIYCV